MINDHTGKEIGQYTVEARTEKRRTGHIVWKCKCKCGNICYKTYTQMSRSKECICNRTLVGKRYGSLIVEEKTSERKFRQVVWKCKCDCGKICYKITGRLKEGTSWSCNCRRSKDLTGQSFDLLTVIRKTEDQDDYQWIWECKCECGNICYKRTDRLTTKRTRVSCGCSRHKDLTGMHFGYLVVRSRTKTRHRRSMVWRCECRCGKTFYSTNQLLKEKKDCGCKTYPG